VRVNPGRPVRRQWISVLTGAGFQPVYTDRRGETASADKLSFVVSRDFCKHPFLPLLMIARAFCPGNIVSRTNATYVHVGFPRAFRSRMLALISRPSLSLRDSLMGNRFAYIVPKMHFRDFTVDGVT